MRIKNCSIALVLMFGLALAGCAREVDLWDQSHEFEGQGLGDAARQAYARQIVNPDPVKHTAAGAAFDGQRMTVAIDEYKKGPSSDDAESGGTSTSVEVPLR